MPGNNSLPKGWINCPKKCESLIEGLFLAFKTPLSSRFNNKIPHSARFTLSMLLNDANANRYNIGMIVNLTDTNRYYDPVQELRDNNIEYVKINCRGQRAPNVHQTEFFINTCYNFIRNNPNYSIGVHCTHGFNRTGFLICSYLIEKLNFSVENAIRCFSYFRPPGIYRQNIINDLYDRYAGPNDLVLSASSKPNWHDDMENNAVVQNQASNRNNQPSFSRHRNY